MALKNLFQKYVYDGGDDGKPPGPTAASAPPGPGWVAAPASHAPQIQAAPGIDPAMLNQLQSVINKRPTPYTALIDSAKLLEQFITDETARFKAAFVQVSSTGGRTAQSVIQALDVHLADIDMEGKQFERALGAQIAERVTVCSTSAQRERDAATVGFKRAEDLHKQADEAYAAATANTVKAKELDEQGQKAASEIESVKQNFSMAVDYIKANLASKRQYLQSILN